MIHNFGEYMFLINLILQSDPRLALTGYLIFQAADKVVDYIQGPLIGIDRFPCPGIDIGICSPSCFIILIAIVGEYRKLGVRIEVGVGLHSGEWVQIFQ